MRVKALVIPITCAYCGNDLGELQLRDGDLYSLHTCARCAKSTSIEAPDGMLLPEACERDLIEFRRVTDDESDWDRRSRKADIADRLFVKADA